MKLPASRLGLGTVQFGTPYGINNQRGQVPFEEVSRILELAARHGVTFVDTARIYGESEAVLGKALSELRLRDRFTVCTKLELPSEYETLGTRELAEATRDSIEASRDALRDDSLDIVLLHRPAHRFLSDGVVWETLLDLRETGRLRHLGVSAATGPEDLDGFLGDPDVAMVQIPFNPLDARWERSGLLDRLAASEAVLVNRSTFLQGLLVMSPDRVTERLAMAAEAHRRWLTAVEEPATGPVEPALRYALSERRIDVTLVGVDSVEQFEEDLRISALPPLPPDLFDRLRTSCGMTDDQILNPSLWPE